MMKKTDQVMTIMVQQEERYSFEEVCQQCQLSEALLLEWLEHGLIPSVTGSFHELMFDPNMMERIRAAYRLQQDLDINLSGVVLALELLDEVAQLREELVILRRHVSSL